MEQSGGPKFVSCFSCRYPCCVFSPLHYVPSAFTSLHNLATHMCHLPYNCHLHSQWARLRHTKVECHIHVSFVPALTETRRPGSLLYFTVGIRFLNPLYHFSVSVIVSGFTHLIEDVVIRRKQVTKLGCTRFSFASVFSAGGFCFFWFSSIRRNLVLSKSQNSVLPRIRCRFRRMFRI